MGFRTEPLRGHELWALAWVLPPVAVLVAAHLVFDLVGASYAAAASVLAREPATGHVATLLQAGFGWSTAALVYLVATAGCIVAALSIIRSRVRGPAARPFRNLAMALAALGLAHLAVVEVLGLPLRTIFDLTMDRLLVVEVLEPWQLLGVRTVVGAINLSSVVVPALIATAAAATALPPRDGWDEPSLVLRSREVKQTIAIAATFMVAGVLHMGAWTHWADAMVAGGDVGRLATGVTLYWGAVFTLTRVCGSWATG